MASIKRRVSSKGVTSFLVQVRLKGYPPQTATFERLTDAKRWAASTESAIREGRHFKTAAAKRTTLADVIDRYLLESVPQKSASQQENQKDHLAFWRERLGDYALADITSDKIIDLRNELARGKTPHGKQRQPSTVNHYTNTLSHVFTMAAKWQLTDTNPLRLVDKLKEPRGRVRWLDDDERKRLLDECRKRPDLYTVVVLALSTGARRMEIWGLHWKDVDLNRGLITFHETKNGERRSVPLQSHALELMRERARVRRIDSDLVFPSPKNPQKPFDFKRPFEQALKAAEIDDFRFHDLRHSAASYLAMSGASLAEIAEVLGHKTLQMVKRYSHLSEGHVSKVVERMNSAIFGGATR